MTTGQPAADIRVDAKSPFIQIEGVAKRFESRRGESVNAIDRISLDIAPR